MTYEYQATLIRIVDADTIRVALDLGLDVTINVTLRLAGLDAPELGTPAGIDARNALYGMLPTVPRGLRIVTTKSRREKYGRYLATVYVDDLDVNAWLITEGHAVAYDGGRR